MFQIYILTMDFRLGGFCLILLHGWVFVSSLATNLEIAFPFLLSKLAFKELLFPLWYFLPQLLLYFQDNRLAC